MICNEAKAQQQLSTMINATVSHELRNPLGALIGCQTSMKSLLKSLSQIIKKLERRLPPDSEMKQFLEKIQKIYNGLQSSSFKMNSAAKLIDFFVHDILDYTILQTTIENFKKNCEVFDIREALQEIH